MEKVFGVTIQMCSVS